jgi:hypothetical protein
VAQFHTFPRSDGSTVEIAVTEKSDGDFHIDALDVEARRAAVMSGMPSHTTPPKPMRS